MPTRHWADDGEGSVCRRPVQRHLTSAMKVLMMYSLDTDMVGEAKGKVRNASDILASGIQ